MFLQLGFRETPKSSLNAAADIVHQDVQSPFIDGRSPLGVRRQSPRAEPVTFFILDTFAFANFTLISLLLILKGSK